MVESIFNIFREKRRNFSVRCQLASVLLTTSFFICLFSSTVKAQSLNVQGTTCTGVSVVLYVQPSYPCTTLTVYSSGSWSLPGASSISYNSNYTQVHATWTTAGTYNVHVSYSCSSGGSGSLSANVVVGQTVAPTVSMSLNKTTVCQWSSIVCTATGTNGGSSPAYLFYVDGTLTQNQLTNVFNTPTTLTPGTHTVQGAIYSYATCATPQQVNTTTQTITVTAPPSVAIQVSPTSYCIGSTVNLTASGTNITGSPTYTWKVNGTQLGWTTSTASFVASASSYAANSITVIVSGIGGNCGTTASSSYASVLTALPLPAIPIVSTNTCGVKQLSHNGTPPNGASWYWQGQNSSGTDYTSTTATSATYSAATTGYYYLGAKFSSGCWSYTSVFVNVDIPSPPTVSAPFTYCEWDVMTLTPNATSANINWYNSSNQLVNQGLTYTPTNLNIGTYTYTMKGVSSAGCVSAASNVCTLVVSNNCDQYLNWTESIRYTIKPTDGSPQAIADGKTYSDGFGGAIQSQVLNFSNTQVLASESIYDALNNQTLTTLPAPINSPSFEYRYRFTINPSNAKYSASDFDLASGPGSVLTPNAVISAGPGTLGWYYSSSNTMEPATPTTSYPYSRSWAPAAPDPTTAKSASAGDYHHMGSGHETQSDRYLIASGELNNYYALRSYFSTSVSTSGLGYKYISTDQDGKKTASFVDADGRTVATAVVTSSSGTPPVVTYDYWNYTYYNDAGQITATIPPNGVTGSTGLPNFVTYYFYDHLGQLIKTITPDTGTSQFVYSSDGKIRFSQNQEQYNASPQRFSYTNYDYLGRLVESGEYTQGNYKFESASTTSPATNSILNLSLLDNVGFSGTANNLEATACTDVTKIYYDLQQSDFVTDANHPGQTYLYGQIAKTSNNNATTWYSYDESGQLIWTKQSIANLGILGTDVKTIDYTYDFLGNVTRIGYQIGQADAFYHHYTYDSDNRLHTVNTSKDGATLTLQATYYYYLHGPLKRVEIATNIQGIDYVYNINGSLKAINNVDATLDPGLDGSSGGHSNFKADAFSMLLDYYSNDYQNIGFSAGNTGLTDHYSGLIKSMTWKSAVDNLVAKNINGFNYDNVNQFSSSQWGTLSGSSGNYTTTFSPTQAYKEAVTLYDKNGNIKALTRNDGAGVAMANYTFNYANNSNQLGGVTNSVQGSSQCISCAELQTQISNYASANPGVDLSNMPPITSYINSTLGQTFSDEQYSSALKSCNLTAAYANFHGVGDINFGNHPQYVVGTSDFSLEGWLKYPNVPSSRYEFLYDLKAVSPGVYSGIDFAVFPGVFGFGGHDGTGNYVAMAASWPVDGQWHHFVYQRIGNRGANHKLFIDGSQVPLAINADNLVTGDLNGGGNTSNLILGGDSSPGTLGPGSGYQGEMRDIRLYKRQMTNAEIQANYNGGSPGPPSNTNALQLWAPLNDGSGTSVIDQSPFAQRGSLEGTDITWTIEQLPSAGIKTNSQILCPSGTEPSTQMASNTIGQMTQETVGSNTVNILYNAYGLVKEIRDGSNNLVESYGYDDRGNKLFRVYYTDGSPIKTTFYISDASGNVISIYDKISPTTAETQIEIPIYGSDRIGEYKPPSNKYFYELKDHLGNVRAVVGPAFTDSPTATFEPANATPEESNFLRYGNAQFINAQLFDHSHHVSPSTPTSPSYSYSQRLNGSANEKYGLARSLNVMPGDKVTIQVYAKYVNPLPPGGNWAGFLAGVMPGITSLDPSYVIDGGSFSSSSTSFPFPAYDPTSNNESGPQAYLAWLVFDKNYKLISNGADQVTTAALEDGSNINHERLYSPEIDITQPGYVYVYLVNENPTPVDVYFDDLNVTQVHSTYVAGGDYYPFGLPITDRQMDAERYRYGYQGQFAEKDSITNTNNFKLRLYEPRFGRWLSPDPYGQYASPYVAMGNNPVSGTDPNGGWDFEGGMGAVFDKSIGAYVLPEVTVTSSFTGQIAGSLAGLTQAAGRSVEWRQNMKGDLFYINPTIQGTDVYKYGSQGWEMYNSEIKQVQLQAVNLNGFVDAYHSAIQETGIAIATAPVGELAAAPLLKVGGSVLSRITSRVAVKAAPKLLNPAINITQRGLDHVLNRHTVNGLAKWASKSKFFNPSEIGNLIRQATQMPLVKQANGNFARVVNAGRSIGIDRATGSPTSIFTVITDGAGNLVTAFPGLP